MNRMIKTKNAPAVIGPYVQAIDIGMMTFISGQIPVCPFSGQIADNIGEQVRQSLENIKAIVEAADLKVANIIKTTVFLTNLNDFAIVNTIYEQFFHEHHAPFPARSCVEVARLPKDVQIEIEAIAAVCP
ncbi:reactive intermediate/imine deaminase [Candidatus Palibaumannia cicadellinicola]|uniref:Reactive intermediate/imine deaminase n=1 Tax=Candidatus Palibaumannia cicadellinicola TaxID=186490 RepID=A0A2N4XVM2_9GAMM|nr:Rid family detoxifying hydrolase [Candidatus Baumannia cicadellinicola]PLK57949.1 reactive intermediate/imine deaminase [Candidatus Baumannia cicadellinicola]